MKPCKLEFCGINSFSERAEVDFTKLLEYGIFGIFGDTGSGKSTILDAVVFALYGSVTRTGGKNKTDIVNYNLDRAYANFEFELSVNGVRKRYRAEREIRKKNGEQKAKVFERKDKIWLTVADGTATKCNEFLKNLLGLEKEEFEKCIALPQGEFAEFVKATRTERLSLVSHLFNLEAYGERLSKKVNQKASDTKSAADVRKAKLEPYEGATKEREKELEGTKKELETEKATLLKALEGAKGEEKTIAALCDKRKRREALLKKREELDAQKEEIGLLSKELSRLSGAAEAVAASDALEKKRGERDASFRKREGAEAEFSAAEAARRVAGEYDFEGAEKEIEALRMQSIAEERAETMLKLRDSVKKQFSEVREKYAEEAKLFPDFDYDGQSLALERELESLKTGDFVQFAEEEFKAELFRGEYAVFAEELKGAAEAYPVAAEAVTPLYEKYSALATGERISYGEVKKAYEAREKKREQIKRAQVDLEKRNALYAAHRERLQSLQTESAKLKEQLAEREEACKDFTLPFTALADCKRKQDELQKAKSRLSECEKALHRAEIGRATAVAEAEAADKALAEAEERLKRALAAGGFSAIDEAKEIAKRFGNAERAQKRVEAFKGEYSRIESGLKETEDENLPRGTEEALSAVRAQIASLEEKREEITRAIAYAEKELETLQTHLELKKQYSAEYEKARAENEIFEKLKELLRGSEFMEFIAEEYLNDIADRAGQRLLLLTGGRYCLRYGDGAFAVGDNFNGGESRGVHTLSGGETFLVSLSLALSLSERICEKSLRPMEFFFLDEGFGTLDSSLVETVIDSLFALKNDRFSIGVISHVEELKHRIDRKLTVKKATEKHGSQIYAE